MPDVISISSLVEEIGRFHVTDKAMRRAQERMVKALAKGNPGSAEVGRYLSAVRTYFAGFEKEARVHLRDVDRRLAKAAQLQFNLTAERSVTTKRVEITQQVLSRVRELTHS